MIVGKPGTENCLNPQRGSTEPVLEQDNKTRQETFIEEQDEKNNTIQNSRTHAPGRKHHGHQGQGNRRRRDVAKISPDFTFIGERNV